MVKKLVYGGVTDFLMGPQLGKRILYPVHAFLLDDLLIDTGSRTSRKHILKEWQDIPIRTIINTHWHEDHIGNNQILQNSRDLTIYAHPLDIPQIKHPKQEKYWLYERLTWGIPEPSQPKEIPPKIQTENYTLEVIHTPGHTPGHIALYEPQKKWLFTGDLYFAPRITYLRTAENFYDQLKSLKILTELEIETLFCSFRGKIDRPLQHLQKKIEFMENLVEKTHTLAHSGVSVSKIRNRLLGREDFMSWMTGGDFTKKHVIEKILAPSANLAN